MPGALVVRIAFKTLSLSELTSFNAFCHLFHVLGGLYCKIELESSCGEIQQGLQILNSRAFRKKLKE